MSWRQAVVADVREMLGELREYRELLFQITRRDLKVRYKQTVMGFGWAVFMPLVNTILFSVIFTRVAPIETPVAYPVYAYCGLAVWNFFRSSLTFATNALVGDLALVTKAYFPREILPLSAVAVCAVDFSVSLSLLALLMIYYGITPGLAATAIPLILAILVAFAFAVGLVLALANLFYRDVKYILDAVLTMWMFATAVVYPLDGVDGWLGTLLALNPLTPLIDGFRSALLLNQWPDPLVLGAVATGSVFLLVACWLFFHRNEFRFAENV